MKKIICIVFSALLISVAAFAGCSMFDGADGRDGQDLNIYDIYEAANAEREKQGLPQLDFLGFLKEYLQYDFEYDENKSLQTVMNRSLLSAVNVIATFGYNLSAEKSYAGAGVIVDLDKSAGDAYVLTNAHVVYKEDAYPNTAKAVSLYLYGNDVFALSPPHIDGVQIVNYSVTYDLALLKVSGSELIRNSDVRAAVFAESDDVYAGEPVYTVGNPGGTGISVTSGIISKESELVALDFASSTDESNIYRVMRTDAGVNGGNSGGALFDTSGRILGIVNAKESDPENENMGYALCGSYVKRLYKLMRDGYRSTSGSYGIRRAVFSAEYGYSTKAYFNNDTGLTEISDTVYILGDYGGFRAGDILKHIKITDGNGTAVEDRDVTRFYNVKDTLISARDGYKITYTVSRNGVETLINFTPTFKNMV